MVKGLRVSVSCEMKGWERLLSNILRSEHRVVGAAMRALKEEADAIMEESRNQVPVDTGTLKESAYVEEPQVAGNEIVVNFGYGGPNDKVNPKSGKPASEYAIYVHERTDLKHPTGKAKFLEDPLNNALRGMDERIGRKIRADINW